MAPWVVLNTGTSVHCTCTRIASCKLHKIYEVEVKVLATVAKSKLIVLATRELS